MNEYTKCCNYRKLVFEDTNEEWSFCGMCLEPAEHYAADEPRDKVKTPSDMLR
jgi:hypothetical protein|tara:strand:- start:2152 stop:2310 length:159 start_codon:yes stop_codon:yes gene_type:complete